MQRVCFESVEKSRASQRLLRFRAHTKSISANLRHHLHSPHSFLLQWHNRYSPSFLSHTGLGTYQSASQLVSYLANLGVTVVRIMSLEPAICFSSLIDSRCWKRRSNVYEGVQHPAYGSQEDLIALVQAIHSKGMLAMIDVDWSGLSRYSDFYDYDGSSIPTSFGPLFQATYDTYEYQAKTCKKFDLSSGSAGETIVSSALSRLATVFGFDGIYWRGLMCLRLDSSNCERGTGSDNAINTQYLREVVSRFASSISFFVGEKGRVNGRSARTTTTCTRSRGRRCRTSWTAWRPTGLALQRSGICRCGR